MAPAHVSFQGSAHAFPLPGQENSRGGWIACYKASGGIISRWSSDIPAPQWAGCSRKPRCVSQCSVCSPRLGVSLPVHKQEPDPHWDAVHSPATPRLKPLPDSMSDVSIADVHSLVLPCGAAGAETHENQGLEPLQSGVSGLRVSGWLLKNRSAPDSFLWVGK